MVCLFKNKVDTLMTDVGKVQDSATETRRKMEVNNERQRRQNNIVINNFKEDVTNSKSKDKELVPKHLKELTNIKTDKEIIEIFRIGKKTKMLQTQDLFW